MDEQNLKEELPDDDLDTYEEEEAGGEDIIGELTTEQLARLQQALKQAEEGNTIPHEMALQLMQVLMSRQNL